MQATNDLNQIMTMIAGFTTLIAGRAVTVHWGQTASMNAQGAIMLPRPVVGDVEEIAMLTRMAVHEAGHLLHTDRGCFDRLDMQTLGLFNLLEDPRMEMEQRRSFAGAGLILERGLETLMAQAMDKTGLDTPERRSRLMQLAILVRGSQIASPKKALKPYEQPLREASEQLFTPEQNRAIDACLTRIPELTNSIECEALAIELMARLHDMPEQPEPNDDSSGQEAGQGNAAQDAIGHNQDQDQEPQPDGGSPEADKSGQANPQQNPDQPQLGDADRDDADTAETESKAQAEGASEAGEDQPQHPSDGAAAAAANDQPGSTGQGEGESAAGGIDGEGCADCAQAQDVAGQNQGQDQELQPSSSSPDADESDLACKANQDAREGSGVDTEVETEAGEAQAEGYPSQEAANADFDHRAEGAAGQQGLPKELPEFTSQDLGELLRQAHAERYGESVEDANQDSCEMQSLTQISPEALQALQQLLERDDVTFEEMLKQGLAVLAQPVQGEIDQPRGGETHVNVHLSQVNQASTTLADHEPVSGAVTNVRLTGVESRLVQVLLRELQNRRKRPLRTAHAGSRVDVGRFWRLAHMGDTRIYRAQDHVSGIDAAVTILLDRSGSMSDILQTAAQVTLAFSVALQRIGNVSTSVAMFPWVTDYTMCLQRFGESPRTAATRIEGLSADGGTPVGQAILAELPRLLAQRKTRRIMTVITDDGPDNPDLLHSAIKQASSQGVEILGVGIGCDIGRFYPLSTSIQDVGQLPSALESLFRNQLAQRLLAT